ncbi:hypothetical protein ABZ915_43495 [Streptomyces sp. NPDC046915]|uniref:hypothetical protein n=1 Tax=Streptomyces sp. NPDC046915 TaxID=3155257 RepID=UPI0033EFB73F
MSNPYVNAPIRAWMYAATAHKVIWVVVVVASAGLLAPPLFFIAAKKRVVAMYVPALYAVFAWGTPIVASLAGKAKNWSGGVLVFTLIIAAVHAAILDTDWKAGR